MSRKGAAPRGARGSDPAPAPAGSFVAVLERRGRFLTAERIFPHEQQQSGHGHRSRSERLVIDTRGSGRGPRSVESSAGDLVLVLPGGRGSGARVVRRIGRPDVARDLIEALMLDRGLRRGFQPEVEREARAAASAVHEPVGGRRDMRSLTTFTIDPVTARDFDDAISAEKLGDGTARVWVHIADVAAHVPEGSRLDLEARRRSTSVYVPGAVEPMLPHALSSDACSLMPGVDRPAVTVELELDGARVTRTAFYRSLIRSDARLDYDRVQRIFDGAERAEAPWAEPLQAARMVSARLQEQREHSGALVLDSEEPEFRFDEGGHVSEVRADPQTESHRLIEHLMIAANEAVARLLEQHSVPCLYRVHERPEPERIEKLADQLASLDVPTPPIPDRLSSTQAADLLGAISRDVDEHVRRTSAGRAALTSLVLRSLKQAYYSPRNVGHAGLHSAAYCHFTSPIRRYPDIVCHRALLSTLGQGERAPRAGELVELGVWTSEREREAMKIERAGDDVARCFALEALLFEQGHDLVFAGEITGLISAGAFIQFSAAPAGEEDPYRPTFEGMLPARSIRPPGRPERARAGGRGGRPEPSQPRDWWELNEQGTILTGERSGITLRLGEQLNVRVSRVDRVRGRVDLLQAG